MITFCHTVKVSVGPKAFQIDLSCTAMLTEVIIWIYILETILFPNNTGRTNALSIKVKILASGFACGAVYPRDVLGIWSLPCG
jgi:hypothetical protein